METADIVIIGGGSTGTSLALHPPLPRPGRIVLLEKDHLAAGATGVSSALIRQHYANAHLIKMVLVALREFQHFEELYGEKNVFTHTGYVVVVGPQDEAALRGNVAIQRAAGMHIELLGPRELKELEPRLHVDDVGLAAWEPESGYADPVGATQAWAERAKELGVQVRQGVVVTGIRRQGGRVAAVQTSRGEIATPVVVNAAGYGAVAVGRMVGVELPIEYHRHIVCTLEWPAGFGGRHPAVSDRLTGAYMRPEGANLTLVSSSNPRSYIDPEPEADRKVQMQEWIDYVGMLVHRFPGLADGLFRRGYTGCYDVPPDAQPILGPVDGVPGFYVAAGMSGHGFKIAPVMGAMLADCILGRPTSPVDIRVFRPGRFAENDLLKPAYSYATKMMF